MHSSSHDAIPRDPTPSPTGRSAGIVLIAISLLMTAVMLHHPSSRSHTVEEFLEEAAHGLDGTGPIHAMLVALGLFYAGALSPVFTVLGGRYGHTQFGPQLGPQLSQLAAIALAFGTLCGSLAGLINGFMVPRLSQALVGRSPDEIGAGADLLHLCRIANQTLAEADVVALSLMLLAIAFLLFHEQSRITRLIALILSAAGLLPLGLLVSGHLPMTVAGFGTFVICQSTAGVALGLWLLRQQRSSAG